MRRTDYLRVEQILSQELPGIPLWYPNNELIHTTRIAGVIPRLDGSFGFLRDAWLQAETK